MSSHINNLLKQAVITFNCKPDLFASNFSGLTSLLDKITAIDVNYHSQFTEETFWKRPGKAPVTCIDIYEDSNFTMGIFILKPKGRLPLHNHPEMYGLIKVITGKVKITSYSLNTEGTMEIERRSFKEDYIKPQQTFTKRNILTAELVSSDIVDTNSRPCVLEPNRKNLHEIESIDGPAAFIDILAPPYMTVIPNNGPRLCSYYSVLSQASPNVFRLQEICTPSWYWTDMSPYIGPKLSL